MMAPPADRRSGVNRSLTPKRRKRVTENDEYAAFLAPRHPRLQPPRRLRRHRRPHRHGPLAADLDHAITEAITALRTGTGYSWADIGPGSASPARPPSNAGAPPLHGHDHRRPRHHPGSRP